VKSNSLSLMASSSHIDLSLSLVIDNVDIKNQDKIVCKIGPGVRARLHDPGELHLKMNTPRSVS
jgi:hypothetical protein